MGPISEIPLNSDGGDVLDRIDAALSELTDEIVRTRKGRTWDIWINERPFHISIDDLSRTLLISAGCNGKEDHQLLRQVTESITTTVRTLIR
jgi:hypothetical protein